MHIEVCQADALGNRVPDTPDPILTIRVDRGNNLKVFIYSDLGTISIPLSKIERATSIAKKEVHSEEFYD